jgi:hypothetical protein
MHVPAVPSFCVQLPPVGFAEGPVVPAGSEAAALVGLDTPGPKGQQVDASGKLLLPSWMLKIGSGEETSLASMSKATPHPQLFRDLTFCAIDLS